MNLYERARDNWIVTGDFMWFRIMLRSVELESAEEAEESERIRSGEKD